MTTTRRDGWIEIGREADGRVEVLDCHVNVDLQGLYEVWIEQLLSDNAYFAALYIGDQVQRLFVGTIWAAGSGDGIWIQGSPESTARRLRINQLCLCRLWKFHLSHQPDIPFGV